MQAHKFSNSGKISLTHFPEARKIMSIFIHQRKDLKMDCIIIGIAGAPAQENLRLRTA